MNRLFSKGIKRGEAPSKAIFPPLLMKERGIKGVRSVDKFYELA